jgi:hypothetical protein
MVRAAAVVVLAATVACPGVVDYPAAVEYRGHTYAVGSNCLSTSAVEGDDFVVDNRGPQPDQVTARNIVDVDPDQAIAVRAHSFGACTKNGRPWVGAVSTSLSNVAEHAVFGQLEALSSRRSERG